MLTKKQDEMLFREVFNYYQKYKNPTDLYSEAVWDGWLLEATELNKKYEGNKLFISLLFAVQGEIKRNSMERAAAMKNQIDLDLKTEAVT